MDQVLPGYHPVYTMNTIYVQVSTADVFYQNSFIIWEMD